MKNLNIFPKTFIYTLSLMLVIVLVAHALIFFLMPVFYKNQQRNMLDCETEALKHQIQNISEDRIMEALSTFSDKLNVGVKLNYKGESYTANFIEPLGEDSVLSFPENDESLNFTINENIYIDGTAFNVRQNNSDFSVLAPSYILINKVFLDQTDDYLITFISLRSVNEATSIIIMLLPITGTICALISIAFSLFYSRAITKPIKQISYVTQQMEALDHNAICEVKTGDEIGILAVNLNKLYQSLLSTIKNLETEINKVSEAEKSKADFLRAASHELKTPVTAVNAMLENMILGVGKYKEHEIYLPKCKDMIEQLSNMIKDILNTSRFDLAADGEEIAEIDLAELIVPLMEPYQIIAKAKGIHFDIDLTDSFSITVPKKLFGKSISNLLSNAVSYTDKGKAITIYFDKTTLSLRMNVPLFSRKK